MDDIASRAQISKKTLYDIFPSKEEILGEVTWRYITEIVHTFRSSLPPDVHPDTLLLSFCRFVFTDRIKNGKQGIFWGIGVDDNEIRKSCLNALKRAVKDIYDSGCQAGIFKPVESVFATEVIVNIVIAALENYHKTSEPLRMFNDALSMIADSIAFKDRIVFDKMG